MNKFDNHTPFILKIVKSYKVLILVVKNECLLCRCVNCGHVTPIGVNSGSVKLSFTCWNLSSVLKWCLHESDRGIVVRGHEMRGISFRTPGVALELQVGVCCGKYCSVNSCKDDPLTIIVDGGAEQQSIVHSTCFKLIFTCQWFVTNHYLCWMFHPLFGSRHVKGSNIPMCISYEYILMIV